MTINATFDDLSEDGFDLLLRIVLDTDVRQIDDWRSIGALIESRNMTVTYIKDGLWSSEIPDDDLGNSFESEFGRDPRVAVAATIIRAHFPDGPAFRIPKARVAEIFTQEFMETPSFTLAMQLAEEEKEQDGKISVYINYP